MVLADNLIEVGVDDLLILLIEVLDVNSAGDILRMQENNQRTPCEGDLPIKTPVPLVRTF